MNRKRTQSYRRGVIGEYIARISYFLRGYKTIAVRYRNYLGEIDLICSKGNLIVFIEVKTRSNPNYIVEGIVGYNQIRRIKMAAKYFLMQPQYREYDIRFDCVIVGRYYFPQIIENCW